MAEPPKVPPYKLHKASGQAFVRLDGRFLYLGTHGSPESHAEYARVIQSVLSGRPHTAIEAAPVTPPLTLRELNDRYLVHARGYYVKNGEQTSEYAKLASAAELATEHFGNLPASEFGPLCLQDVRDRLIAKGLARTTVNSQTRRIVRIFKWGTANELVPETVHRALKSVDGLRAGRTVARESVPVRPVADAIVDATLPELPEVVADMVRFQRLTGCRPTETCSVRPCDVDRTGDVWLYRPESHKTEHHGRERVIFIGPKGQGVLLRYLARDPMAYCFRPCDSEAKRRAEAHAARVTPLSCGNRPGTNVKASPLRPAGERYPKDSYANAIRRACKRAGVEQWSPNQLRHTAATMARAEFGLDGAQLVLGHAHARTSEIYAEKNLAAGAEIARRIG